MPKDHTNGPRRYGIAQEASLTVLLCRNKKVQVVHTLAEGQIDTDRIAAIMADTDAILDD